jgi:hypothetical protein
MAAGAKIWPALVPAIDHWPQLFPGLPEGARGVGRQRTLQRAQANPPATRRRALELLAASRDGATEAILLAVEMLVDLVRAGLATAKAHHSDQSAFTECAAV